MRAAACGRRREFVTESDEQTVALGRRIAAEMRPPLLVLLIGNLGTGKTTFAKGVASGLGAAVRSCSGSRKVRATFLPFTSRSIFASTIVFQALQPAQRPTHLAARVPHSWQTKTVLGGFMFPVVASDQWLVVTTCEGD